MERSAQLPPAGGPQEVTVAICNFNGAEHLPPCLDALLAQTFAIDELLVFDNESTDDSAQIVRTRYPSARWIPMGRNDGPCPARNQALRQARNRWVLLVDNDAVCAPDVLEKLVAAARAHPDAPLLQPRSVFASDPSRVHYDGGALHYAGLFSLRNFHVPVQQAQGSGTLEVGGAVSVVLLCDREVLLERGGFDEAYFILFEDLDLSYRLRMAGHRILSVEDASVLHRGGTGGISFRGQIEYPRRRAFFHSRNRWLYLVKDYSWRTLLAASPGLLLYELVWALFTLRSGTFGGWWDGKRDFLRRLPAALRARRSVQAARRVGDRRLLVGGPLTISAQLSRPGAAGGALRVLDHCLRAWWGLARWLVG